MTIAGNNKAIGAGIAIPYVIPIDESGNVIGAAGGVAAQVQGNVAAGSADSGNPVKAGGKFTATSPTLVDGQRGDLQLDSRGSTVVTLSTTAGGVGSNPSGAGADGDGVTNSFARLLAKAYSAIFNGTTWDRLTKATTTSRIPSSAATTNPTSGKSSAGTVYAIEAYNTTATVKYLKTYNKASAPTVGTDTPVRTIALKPQDRTVVTFPSGYYFGAGIAYALTGAAADSDTTALAAGDVTGLNIDYS